MVKEVKKYKVVRRGPKWCVRVKGTINTNDSWHWCRERKMEYHIKQHWYITRSRAWPKPAIEWDYDFIFDKEHETTAFILGYL